MNADQALSASLFAICQAMVSSLELNEVLDTILRLTVDSLRADTGSILLYEEGSDRLKMLAARGLPEEVVKRGHISRRGSPAEWVIEHNEPRIFHGKVDSASRLDTIETAGVIKSALCVPLRAKGKVIGALNLSRKGSDAAEFTPDDLNQVMILASQAAICIENARLYRENVRQARLAAIGQTVAGLSHCIKNMLSGLRGGVGLMELAEQASDWDMHGKGMSVLRRNVDRISYLVLDMLDYSREKTPIRHEVPVAKLIDEVYDTVAYKAEPKAAALTREVAPGAETIHVDPDQMFRCLLNLVENAVDAVVAGDGRVHTQCATVSEVEARGIFGEEADLEAMGAIMRLSVVDNGQGIDPEHLPTIFLPFFSTKASKGTGLGLAVTKKLVEEHGGKILVDSQKGRGAAFHLILPERDPRAAENLPLAAHQATG